jgi:hypothetical protein
MADNIVTPPVQQIARIEATLNLQTGQIQTQFNFLDYGTFGVLVAALGGNLMNAINNKASEDRKAASEVEELMQKELRDRLNHES